MKALKLTMAALLVLGAVQTRADQTNLVQTFSIYLFGVQQGRTVDNSRVAVTSADVVRVDTRRVIDALGAATGQNFSFASRLVVVTPLSGGNSSIQVRDGTNRVDVSGYFVHDDWSETILSSYLDKRTGRFASENYSIQHFALQDGANPVRLHFDVNGFTVESSSNGFRGERNALDADVAGSGDRNGDLVVLRGAISVHGDQLEVVGAPSDPPQGGNES